MRSSVWFNLPIRSWVFERYSIGIYRALPNALKYNEQEIKQKKIGKERENLLKVKRDHFCSYVIRPTCGDGGTFCN